MVAKLRNVRSAAVKWKRASYLKHHTGKLEKACGEKELGSLDTSAETAAMWNSMRQEMNRLCKHENLIS